MGMHAVVTGGNKGIGFEICKQLASNGVVVILTGINEKLGNEALHKLKELGLSGVVFHQLDVTDSDSLVTLVKFIETNFGKLDILVNNAGVSGVKVNLEMLNNLQLPRRQLVGDYPELANHLISQSYEGSRMLQGELLWYKECI